MDYMNARTLAKVARAASSAKKIYSAGKGAYDWMRGAGAKQSVPRSIRAPSQRRSGGFSFTSVGGKELNYVDYQTLPAGEVIGNAGVFKLLNGLKPGVGASERVGKRVMLKSIEWHFQTQNNNIIVPPVYGSNVRLALVLDKQPNAALPANNLGDIWQVMPLQSSPDPWSLRNMDQKPRFWVLAQSPVTPIVGMIGNASGFTTSTYVVWEGYKRVSIPVQYNAGVSGGIGDIQTNALYMTWLTDGGIDGLQPVPNISFGTIRLRYDDSV